MPISALTRAQLDFLTDEPFSDFLRAGTADLPAEPELADTISNLAAEKGTLVPNTLGPGWRAKLADYLDAWVKSGVQQDETTATKLSLQLRLQLPQPDSGLSA